MKEKLDKLMKKVNKPISFEDICKKLDATDSEKLMIKDLLKDGVESYDLYKAENGSYKKMNKTSFRVGTYVGSKNGNGKVITAYQDYQLDSEFANGAIDGDKVLIDTFILSSKNASKSSRVKKIIERNVKHFVGEISKNGKDYYLIPDDKKFNNMQLLIDDGLEHIDGEIVNVSLKEKRSDDFYTVNINDTLGHKDDPGVDIIREASKHGFVDVFPDEVLEETKNVPTSVSEKDLEGRLDLRDEMIYTIDGDDTKDRDDAISIKKTDYGYLLGVHIADVSYYVPEGSALDIEAKNRGTSAYLANKVIPMLPHKLSNGICSLNSDVDRLTLSCLMKFDNDGNLLDSKMYESVIHSGLEMTYSNVNSILDKGIVPNGYEKFADNLKLMNEFAEKVRKNRNKKGTIDLDIPEYKFVMDSENKPIEIIKRVQGTGEKLIEDAMISSNVAESLLMENLPFLYRVHDCPKEERIEKLNDIIRIVGIKYNSYVNSSNESVQNFANYINRECGALAPMLNMHLLRSFAKAKYSPNNIGHYGLSEQNYSHTTSPIRRYPDLVNQRIVKELLLGKLNNKKNLSKWKSELPVIGELASEREVDAAEAERQVFLMKCAEYMHQFEGEDFVGSVTGMDIDGLYITLDNGIEVKAKIRDLPGKYFLNDSTYSMLSVSDESDYFLGDVLSVKIEDANKSKKTIDVSVNKKLEETNVSTKYQNTRTKQYAKRKSDNYFNAKAKHIKSV